MKRAILIVLGLLILLGVVAGVLLYTQTRERVNEIAWTGDPVIIRA